MPLSIYIICINTHTSIHTDTHAGLSLTPPMQLILHAHEWEGYQQPRLQKPGDTHVWHIHFASYSWLGEKCNFLGPQMTGVTYLWFKKKKKKKTLKFVLEAHNSWQMGDTFQKACESGPTTRKQQCPELTSLSVTCSRCLAHLGEVILPVRLGYQIHEMDLIHRLSADRTP